MLSITVGALAHIPEQNFAFGSIFQRNQAQVEKREEFFAMLQSIVIVLAIILNRNRLAQVAQFYYDLGIVLFDLDRGDVFDDCFDLFQDIGYEDGVIRRQKAARFLDDSRMRDVFIVAHLLDCVDDVVGGIFI